MGASAFWRVIGTYNESTKWIQLALLAVLVIAVIISYRTKYKWLLKVVLGILNLFIAIGFFATFGTEPIQKFFALPLYLGIGILFLVEAWRNRSDELTKPGWASGILMALYAIYPLVSMAFGAGFPEMVTHIMPCPIVTISIALYSCYKRRNSILLILLTIWGLTGVKSVIFNAYEDIILLLAGIYGVYLCGKTIKARGLH